MNQHLQRMADFETRFNSNNVLSDVLGTPKMNPMSLEGSSQKEANRKVLVDLSQQATLPQPGLIPIREEDALGTNYSHFLVSDLDKTNFRTSLQECGIQQTLKLQ